MSIWGSEKGIIYNRRSDIHDRFGGQQQGGIVTPAKHPLVIAFTGKSGVQHGYADEWVDGVFRYFGEGQEGDMTFRAGNRAVRDHIQEGKDLLVFRTLGKGKGVQYLGTFICSGFAYEQAPDKLGSTRQAIVFHLLPEEEVEAHDADVTEEPVEEIPSNLSALRAAAIASATQSQPLPPTDSKRLLYKRSRIVRAYVLARAAGACEGCSKPAPFFSKDGKPYLEPHHLRRISDGGPDDPRFIAALCPNCHREVHYGGGGADYNERLFAVIMKKESSGEGK